MSVPAGPGGADADADVARHGARVAVGHVRGALDVAGQDVADAAVLAHRRVERVDGRARARRKRPMTPSRFQHADRGLHGLHLRHRCLLPVLGLFRFPNDPGRGGAPVAPQPALS